MAQAEFSPNFLRVARYLAKLPSYREGGFLSGFNKICKCLNGLAFEMREILHFFHLTEYGAMVWLKIRCFNP